MSKTFPEKILKKSTKTSMSVFPRLFVFYRVVTCFLATGVQKHHQKKSFYTKTDKKIPNRFFLDFFYHFFLAFLGEGSSKTRSCLRMLIGTPDEILSFIEGSGVIRVSCVV
jgi:hypothetical protein